MRTQAFLVLAALVEFTNQVLFPYFADTFLKFQAALGKQHLCKLSKRIELCNGCHKILTTQISSENVHQLRSKFIRYLRRKTLFLAVCKMVVLGCDGGCMAGKYLQLMISTRGICTRLTERDLCLHESEHLGISLILMQCLEIYKAMPLILQAYPTTIAKDRRMLRSTLAVSNTNA